ncbi:MAG TPA: helix-hairpin-helix domain-containing protein [Longimicrobiaceae bacterium]|nr:helix-hairpin-helix domain-containing protein [Longimicrobiaceae bacterium]
MGATRQEMMALGVLGMLLAGGVGVRALRAPGDAPRWASPDAAAEAPGAGQALLARSAAVAAGDAAAHVPLGAGEKVDPNTATATELRRLPRVSRALAERMVAWRTQHGGFRTLADLDSVQGVGAATLERLAPHLALAAAPASAPAPTPAPAPASAQGGTVARAPALLSVPAAERANGAASGGGPVDVNAAGPEALDRLPGIGPALAARIVAWRSQNGAFRSVDDLARVPGIGPAKLERLRSEVRVSP